MKKKGENNRVSKVRKYQVAPNKPSLNGRLKLSNPNANSVTEEPAMLAPPFHHIGLDSYKLLKNIKKIIIKFNFNGLLI